MNLYSIPPLLTLCCFLGLVALTVLKGSRTKVNILFLLLCILGSILYLDIVLIFNVKNDKTALLISRIDHFFIIYLIPLYIHFFHEYLGISGRKWLLGFAYCYAFILMCFTPTSLYLESMQKLSFGYFAKGGILYPFFGLGGLCVSIYVLTILWQTIRKEKNSVKKNRLKYLFLGFGIMGLMNGLNAFPILGYSVYPPGNFSFIPLIIFAVGLFKHDLFDMGILVKKSLIYSLLTALLTCFYSLIIITANKMSKDFDFTDSIYFPISLFLLIVIIFGPLKIKVQAFIDGVFLKGKYDYQKTIKDVSRMIVSVLNYDEIGKQIIATVADTIRVDNCSLFIGNSTGSVFIPYYNNEKNVHPIKSTSITKELHLVKFLEKQRKPILRNNLKIHVQDTDIQKVISDMDKLSAEIALPMIFNERLNGFILLGEKLSGDLFTSEDLDLLETLSSQTALAIENASSYKLIDDLNKNLENKVNEKTRDLKNALTEKERTQEQLIQSESLAAIGQLVAGVAHELNNPLTSVTSLIQTTLEEIERWDTKTEPIKDIIDDLRFTDKELARAKSIVKSLLDLSRQTHTYSEPVNLNLVIKDALRVLYNQYKQHDMVIVEKYFKDIPYVQGNFANLGQVAINIIKNAFQSLSGKGGKIFLTTRFEKDSGQVVFECKDTGDGIPESIRQDIFKPFFTTKEVGKGTGLGLYISHEIIQRHGGALSLEKTDETGARFVIRLPVTEA